MRRRTLILSALGLGSCSFYKFNTESKWDRKVHAGNLAMLKPPPGLKKAYVALKESDCYELQKQCAVADEATLETYIREGKAFSLQPGVRVAVLKDHYNERQIRILEGPELERTGWVPFEWLELAQKGTN